MIIAPPRKRKSRARQKPEPVLGTSVATAPQINVFALPAYVPEQRRSARPGADDHLQVHSRGDRT